MQCTSKIINFDTVNYSTMENSDWKDKLALAFNINVENIDNQPDEPQEVKHDIDKRSLVAW